MSRRPAKADLRVRVTRKRDPPARGEFLNTILARAVLGSAGKAIKVIGRLILNPLGKRMVGRLLQHIDKRGGGTDHNAGRTGATVLQIALRKAEHGLNFQVAVNLFAQVFAQSRRGVLDLLKWGAVRFFAIIEYPSVADDYASTPALRFHKEDAGRSDDDMIVIARAAKQAIRRCDSVIDTVGRREKGERARHRFFAARAFQERFQSMPSERDGPSQQAGQEQESGADPGHFEGWVGPCGAYKIAGAKRKEKKGPEHAYQPGDARGLAGTAGDPGELCGGDAAFSWDTHGVR